jgi:hypothetical protein
VTTMAPACAGEAGAALGVSARGRTPPRTWVPPAPKCRTKDPSHGIEFRIPEFCERGRRWTNAVTATNCPRLGQPPSWRDPGLHSTIRLGW